MTKDGRIRLFEIVQYDEFWKPDKAIEWLNKVRCDYLAVKHDKDKNDDGTPKGIHYHIAVKLKDGRTLDDIAKNCSVEKQYIQFVDRFKDKCAYLFHLTKNARRDNKYEYDNNAVISCKHITYEEIKERSIEYDKQTNHDEEIRELLYKYGDCKVSKSDVFNKLTPVDYAKFALLFEKMKKFRIMKVRVRNMQVIYITGGAGTGKTTLAKYIAKTYNYDYFVSGSGKDFLDGYDKEECIILDDFRGDLLTKAELFKLCDNNTNSSVKSRFQNKDVSFCKLMIFTSVYPPHYVYNWDEEKLETFKQFARRLNNSFVYIKDDGGIWQIEYNDMEIGKQKKLDFDMNGVFAVLGISKFLGADLMNQVFKKVSEKVREDQKKQDEDLPF